MKTIIPARLSLLAQKLDKPLYVVGGTCRNYFAGLPLEDCDLDICAAVSAEQLCSAAEKAGFDVTAVYKHTGTVRLAADGVEFEYACFRTDKYVRGEHSPHEVCFTDDIFSDARRRDFKCNAIYYDIAADKFVDPLFGIEQARRGVLDTVAPAGKVFGEDGLRLMRLCRLAAQTGFTPTRECFDGVKENAALIRDIAAERIWAELRSLLVADTKYGVKGGQYKGLKLLHATCVLGYILPELAAGDNMPQREDFHSYDVLEHSLRCVMYAPEDVRLAALLHDVGKPYCKINYGRFAMHEEEGARIAADICARLRVPKRTAERVCGLVKYHMYDFACLARESKVRRFIAAHRDILPQLLELKQADFSACKDDTSVAPCVEKWKKILDKMSAEGVPESLKELNVRGDELERAGVKRENIGKALNFLLGECAVDAGLNEKNRLIKRALAQKFENKL